MKAQHIVDVLLEEEPFDPDKPVDPKDELNRAHPQKAVRFRGNDMLHAPGIISAAQTAFRSKNRQQIKWAMKIVRAWPGLTDEEYTALLQGRATIKTEGNDAVVTLNLWK